MLIDSSKTHFCWRDEQIGDHTHIFRNCPKLKSYWEGIRTEFFFFYHFEHWITIKTLFFIFFGAIPNGAIEKRKLYLLLILLLVARKKDNSIMAQTITTHHTSVTERVMKVCAMEKITAKPHVKMDISLIRSAPFSAQVRFPLRYRLWHLYWVSVTTSKEIQFLILSSLILYLFMLLLHLYLF